MVESGWNEEALQGVFLNALGSDVKDELTSREESSDLEHLIALAIRVDNRLRERHRERAIRSSTPSSMPPTASRPPFSVYFPPRHKRRPLSESEPMQIGRTHLSPEERERRILSRACLYCGQMGHFLSGCPSRPGKGAGSPVTRGILVSRALDPSVSCPLLWQDQTPSQTILLYSGADESFIDLKLVHQLGIDTVPHDSPIETQALDGRPLARVERRTVPVNLLVLGNHHKSISLLVISSPLSPVVLGYPWLKTHNPQIDWATGQVISWSTHCLSHCLRSAQSPWASELGSTTAPPDLSSVPEEYHNLAVVFSKSHALSVPPHRPYDCAIDLLPGSPLPSSRLFNLSRPERESMEDYIGESLAAGIIRPSSSPGGAGFFFMSKKDRSLRPCIDYRGLNNITLKNKYPLPLTSSGFVPLHGAVVFSKLGRVPFGPHPGG